jgi:hypothetical protein
MISLVMNPGQKLNLVLKIKEPVNLFADSLYLNILPTFSIFLNFPYRLQSSCKAQTFTKH